MRHNGTTAVRTTIRHVAIKTMHATGSLKSARRAVADSAGTVVLALHRIIPDTHVGLCRSPRGMVLRESAFCALLAYLKHHTIVLRPGSIPQRHHADGRPHVLLTFDDGWADNFSIAAPHLARFDMAACFFVVTGYAGVSEPFWPEQVLGLVRPLVRTGHRVAMRDVFAVLQKRGQSQSHLEDMEEESFLCWLKQLRPEVIRAAIAEAEQIFDADIALDLPDAWERLMTWDELRVMAQAGHTIAPHTSTHALLTRLSAADASSELREPSNHLQHCVGTHAETQWIAYPNGDNNSLVRQLAYENGYRYGFTTVPGIWRTNTKQLAIPRINIWDGTLLSPEGKFDESYLEYNLFWRALRA